MKKPIIVIAIIALGAAGGYFFFTQTSSPSPAWSGIPKNDVAAVSLEGKKYTHPSFRFSLTVPKETEITSRYEEGGAETILFEVPDTDPVQSFQLYIAPYSESQITEAQVQKDTGGRAQGPFREVIIGGGVRALVFYNENQGLGRLREAWFVTNGHIVEATAYDSLDVWLSHILATFEPNRP